jgi:hypothetical protein
VGLVAPLFYSGKNGKNPPRGIETSPIRFGDEGQVNSNEPAMMNLALNNASNVVQYYKDQ